LFEIARARELRCAAMLLGEHEYGTSLEDLDRYFLAFAAAARNARSHPTRERPSSCPLP